MKIGKYPVKHTYKVSRIVADVLSLGIAVLIVSATFGFLQSYADFYNRIDLSDSAVAETLIKNDPNYEWKQYISLIFPLLAAAVFAVYLVLVLKSHQLRGFDINKRNAQRCYDAYAFGASLVKLPALMIVFDYMVIVQDKLLSGYYGGLSWFSWLTVLCVLLILIAVRYTMHRLQRVTAKPQTAEESSAIKVKAVAADREESAEADEIKPNEEEA